MLVLKTSPTSGSGVTSLGCSWSKAHVLHMCYQSYIPHQGFQMPGYVGSYLRGRDREQGMGQRAEVAEAIQLLKQVFEKGILIPGILLRPPLLVLQELAQMSAGWGEGSPLVTLNWKMRPVCPISQMGSQASRKGRTTESRENCYMACPGWMHHPQAS